jgi:hypothetical protein
MRALSNRFFRNLKKGIVPLNRAIISDILLWVVLILALSGAIYLFAVRIPEKQGQTIILHFKDANEIIKGSSVQMLGTEIGYVGNIKILQDHVDVTVQTYPNALPIPPGATFTILFTGLGGSKSIEVELPGEEASPSPRAAQGTVMAYKVEEPIRIKQVFDANIDVTRALQQGAENITDFFGKKKPVEELQVNIRQMHQGSIASLQFVHALNTDLGQMQKVVQQSARDASNTMNGASRQFAQIAIKTQPARIRPQVTAGLRHILQFQKMFARSTTGTTQTALLDAKLTQLNQGNAQLSAWLQHAEAVAMHFNLNTLSSPLEQRSSNLLNGLVRTDDWLQTHPLAPALEQAGRAIQTFNRQVLNWTVKVDAALAKQAQKQSPLKRSGRGKTPSTPIRSINPQNP